jgi:hypothetical protein
MKIISRATGSLSFCFTTWLSTSTEFLNQAKNTFKFTHLFFNRKCSVSVVTRLIKGEYTKNLLRKKISLPCRKMISKDFCFSVD